MALLQHIEVKESNEALQRLYRQASVGIRPRLKMLLLLQKGMVSTGQLSATLRVSDNCIGNWKKRYAKEGLKGLVTEKRGGNRPSALFPAQRQLLEQRLRDPKGGFISYKEAVAWINETFGFSMKYHAVNKYLKYQFGTKLKVGRKTHIQKDPLAEETFKKGTL